MTPKVGQVQPQATTQPESKTHPQKQENIVIEFTSLPKELRTEKVRKFYDKDGSGFLETKNTQGQNEYDLMKDFAKSMGVDLSKYKSDIVRVEKDYNAFVGYNASGKKVRRAYSFDSSNSGSTKIDVKNSNGSWNGVVYNKDFNPTDETSITTPYGSKGFINKWVRPHDDGSYTVSWDTRIEKSQIRDKGFTNDTLYNKQNEIIAIHQEKYLHEDKKSTQVFENKYYEREYLTNGKNKLTKVDEYSLKTDDSYTNELFMYASENELKRHKDELLTSKLALNGVEVQAKPIGKGRYEVIMPNGEIKYISHDGFELKAEYVRTH